MVTDADAGSMSASVPPVNEATSNRVEWDLKYASRSPKILIGFGSLADRLEKLWAGSPEMVMV